MFLYMKISQSRIACPDAGSGIILCPSRFKWSSKSFLPGQILSRHCSFLSKPFEIHPALLVLIGIFFVSVMFTLWTGELFSASTSIAGFVLAWAAVCVPDSVRTLSFLLTNLPSVVLVWLGCCFLLVAPRTLSRICWALRMLAF